MSQFPKSPVQEICTPGGVGVGLPKGGSSTRRSYPNTMEKYSDNLKVTKIRLSYIEDKKTSLNEEVFAQCIM